MWAENKFPSSWHIRTQNISQNISRVIRIKEIVFLEQTKVWAGNRSLYADLAHLLRSTTRGGKWGSPGPLLSLVTVRYLAVKSGSSPSFYTTVFPYQCGRLPGTRLPLGGARNRRMRGVLPGLAGDGGRSPWK